MNVLRPWKPTYSVQIVLFGILFLFSHPNPNDPLNDDAAAVMRGDIDTFRRNVTKAMKVCVLCCPNARVLPIFSVGCCAQGERIAGVSFPKNRGLK